MEVGVSHQLHRDRLTVLTEDFSLVMEEWGEVLVQVGILVVPLIRLRSHHLQWDLNQVYSSTADSKKFVRLSP